VQGCAPGTSASIRRSTNKGPYVKLMTFLAPFRRLSLACLLAAGLPTSTEAASRREARAPETLPRSAPLPPPKPDAIGVPDDSSPQPENETTAAIPVPPPRPTDLPSAPAAPASVVREETDEADTATCLDRLVAVGVKAEAVPPIRDGACGADKPVRLSELPDGVAVSPPATVTCPVAEALARWTHEALKAEADRILQSAPTRLVIGTSYECRNQNRQTTGKLSEHAFANAVDVMGFEFASRKPIPVTFHPGGSAEAAFLNAVRTGACAHFTTVLGPGSDIAHANHLHLDLRGRRGAARLCQ
jgi:hypothetical protein